VLRGYVEDLREVYDGHSVLLSPVFLRGGIKTKIPEAFARGCPVAGNAAAFEGLGLADYPLMLETEAEWRALVTDPKAWLAQLREGARAGRAFVVAELSPRVFRARWRAALGVEPVDTPG
jgi:hypothetical protein